MANGNKNVKPGEGLFFIAYDDIDVYSTKDDPTTLVKKQDIPPDQKDKYEWNKSASQNRMDQLKADFIKKMLTKYKSMKPIDQWLNKQHVILQTDAFYIALEDNNWSAAVKILRNTKNTTPRQRQYIAGLRRSVRDTLLELTPTIYIRTGTWEALPIDKQTAKLQDKTNKKVAKIAKEMQLKTLTEEDLNNDIDPDGVD